MSIIVSRATLAAVADWMNHVGRPVGIRELAQRLQVGYNRAAEITRYGTRQGWYTQSWRHGASAYFPSGSRPAAGPNTGATAATAPPADIPITFSVEAEMDFIRRDFDPDDPSASSFAETNECHSDATAATAGWRSRSDCTVGAEIASPVWRNVEQAADSSRREWEHWMSMNEEDDHANVPYLVGSNRHGNGSIGMHIHVGTQSRALTRTEKSKIANYALMEYPLVIAISANSPNQGFSSYRIGHLNRDSSGSGFARSMTGVAQSISAPSHGCGDQNHYMEISDSHHGTVEFRAQDSTVPQAYLACCFLLQKLAEKALTHTLERTEPQGGFDWPAYSLRRRHACGENGPTQHERSSYIDELTEKLGDITLDDAPESVKEVLFLGLNRGIWPGKLYQRLADTPEKKYAWFSRLLTQPERFLSAILAMELATQEQETALRELAAATRGAHKLSDLKIGMTTTEIPAAPEPAEATPTEVTYREATTYNSAENGWFRLNQLDSRQLNEAETLTHGGNLHQGQPMSVRTMLSSPDRFLAQVNHHRVTDVWVWGERPNARPRARRRRPPQPNPDDIGQLHGLEANGSFPWTCSTCHVRFASHAEHVQWAYVRGTLLGEDGDVREDN